MIPGDFGDASLGRKVGSRRIRSIMAEEDLHLRPTTSDEGSELVEPAETRRGMPFIRTLSWTEGLSVLLRSRTEKYKVYVVLCTQYLPRQ